MKVLQSHVRLWIAAASLIIVLGIVLLWHRHEPSRRKVLHTSTRELRFTEGEVTNAINKAFADARYHGMGLLVYCPEFRNETFRNGFILWPMEGAIAYTHPKRLNEKPRPYIPEFHISTIEIGPRATKVSVQTISARGLFGLTPTMLFGWVQDCRDVEPEVTEELKILDAIDAQLSGHNSLQKW